jgi:hypothetical protein
MPSIRMRRRTATRVLNSGLLNDSSVSFLYSFVRRVSTYLSVRSDLDQGEVEQRRFNPMVVCLPCQIAQDVLCLGW